MTTIVTRAGKGSPLTNTEMDTNLINLNTAKIEAAMIHAATSKTTPVDADELALLDSTDSFTLKKLTWENLKATVGSAFATLTGTETLTNKTLTSPVINGNGIVFNDASTQNTAATGFGFKNRIINGAMMIDQRNAGASVTPSADTHLLDRWTYQAQQASKFTWQQNKGSVTPPVGFTNYLGGSVASAVTVGDGDLFLISQFIEGYNIADLGWGTANAKTITLSFQVYSSLTGTFGGVLGNSAQDRSYPFTYSIPVANTWTTISVTVAGDTSGTWLTTSGVGLRVRFGLGVGSIYSGTAGSWASATYFSATGATSVVGTNGATFYITGVQLEKGSVATPFDYRPYGTELQLCQRYFLKLTYDADSFGKVFTPYSDSAYGGGTDFPTTMRATPTYTSTGNVNLHTSTSGNINVAVGAYGLSPNGVNLSLSGANAIGAAFANSGFSMSFNSEL